MNRPFRLLVRHFLRRFLDNDLISPNGESHENTALFLAVLVVPNLLGSVFLVFKYANPWLTPAERLVMGLNDKVAFLCTSIILTALVTVVEWDALWLDERDRAILGPMPIPARTLVGAKLAALGLFVAAVATLVNAVPALAFPFAWLATMPIGFSVGVWFVIVHGFVLLGSSVFAFAAILAVRGLLATALPVRAFRAASMAAQFLAILVLVSAFLLSPALYHDVEAKLASGSRLVLAAPPMWFLGLYERLTAGVVLDQPVARTGKYWSEWIQEEDTKARSAYRAIEPAFGQLARRAAVGLGAAVALALGLFAFGHLRRAGQMSLQGVPLRHRRWRRLVLAPMARLLAGRAPISRGTFAFTLQTLARSARNRLYVAGYLAGGIALVVASQDPRVLRSLASPGGALTRREPGLLVIQLILAFALIVGLRVGFPIPSELPANWVFRVTEPSDLRPALAGVRRAFRAVAVGFLAVLIPWHAALWGWQAALQHFAAGAMISLILVDGLLISFPKVPFTVPYVQGRSKLRYTWALYLFFFWVATYLFATIEFHAMGSARSFGVFTAFLAVILAALAWRRRAAVRHLPGLSFDDVEDRAVQTLGLMP